MTQYKDVSCAPYAMVRVGAPTSWKGPLRVSERIFRGGA